MNKIAVVNNQGRVSCMSLTEQRVFDKEHLHQPVDEYHRYRHVAFCEVTVNCTGTELAAPAATRVAIAVWKLESGEYFEMTGFTSFFAMHIQYSPSETCVLVTAHFDTNVRLWNTELRCCLAAFTPQAYVMNGIPTYPPSIAIHPRSNDVFVGTSTGKIEIWEHQTSAADNVAPASNNSSVARMKQSLDVHGNAITTICISKDGSKLGVGARDGALTLVTLSVSRDSAAPFTRALDGHTAFVSSVKFSSDASRVVSGSYDYTVKLWEVDNGACLASFTGHTNLVTTVCLVDNDKFVYSAAEDLSIRVWDLEQLEQPSPSQKQRRQQPAAQSVKDFEANNSVPPSISEAYAVVQLTAAVTCICPFPASIVLM
jgi:WD40 repeat protein